MVITCERPLTSDRIAGIDFLQFSGVFFFIQITILLDDLVGIVRRKWLRTCK